MMFWSAWWLWALAAILLAGLELLLPGYVFLGFALGAALVALIFGLSLPSTALLAGSLPITLVVFAIISLASWLALRRMLGVQPSQRRIWTRDINED